MAIFSLRITPVRKAGSPLGNATGRAAHHGGHSLAHAAAAAPRVSHGATGKAAYLSGSRMVVGELVTDYRGKHGVEHAQLILPGGGTCDRETLWNAVDAHRTQTPTATIARDIIVALPHELTFAQRREAAVALATWIAERYRVAVDLGMHQPEMHNGSDSRNYHAHLLASERQVSPTGELGKVQREFNQLVQRLGDKSRGRDGGKATAAAEIRAAWERIANEALQRAGHDARVDARTLADQGIERVAGQHLGPAETRRLRAGKQRSRAETRTPRAGQQRSPAETRTARAVGADVRAELARKARELALAEMTALQEIAAIQEARKTTPAPAQVFADVGSITAWQHDALGMLARYWQAEDRAMQLRRKMRAAARRRAELRTATAEEQRALRSAGRRLSRSRALLQGVSETLLAMPPTLAVEIEPSDRPLTKQRLKTIKAAVRDREREHEIGVDRW
ncbi:MAG: MobA/MobL family protein [Rhodospirillales bacterium]|nr:MobA/MobL family protein [Rhodospirillales bacterium]